MPPKTKRLFVDAYTTEFPFTKRSKKGEEFAHCTVCNDDINLASIGKNAITHHQQTQKHQKSAAAANRTASLRQFLPSTSNAFVERVFSLCGSQWTDERNSLKVETIKALAQTKINFDHNCPQMYQMLISNNKLLDEIGGSEKYKSKI